MDQTNIFVKFLPSYIDDDNLYMLFSPFGSIVSAKVIVDPFSGESKGFGFVNFSRPLEAQQAIECMAGYRMGNKSLLCKLSDPFSLPEPSRNIYVKPLPLEMTEGNLWKMFSVYGHISSVKIYEATGISDSVVGLVRYDDVTSATRAVNKANGLKLFSNLPCLTVKYSESGEQRAYRKANKELQDRNTSFHHTNSPFNNIIDNNNNRSNITTSDNNMKALSPVTNQPSSSVGYYYVVCCPVPFQQHIL